MEAHLGVLPIIVPLIGAPLCLLIRRRPLVLGLSVALAWTSFVLSIVLLARVLEVGEIRYFLGGWAPPIGIEYRIDVLSAFVVAFVSGLGVY